MTAQLVQHGNRKPLPDVSYKWKGQDGDEELGSRPFVGQLWERVGELAPDTLGALGESVRVPSRPGFIATVDRRGPRLNGGFKRNPQPTNTYRMCASGIIRAGERVK